MCGKDYPVFMTGCLLLSFCVFSWYTWVGSCIIPWTLPCLSPSCFSSHFNIVLYHYCPLLFKHQIIETFTMMVIVKFTNDMNSLQFWNIKLTRERCGNHDGLLCEALLWTWTMNFKCAVQNAVSISFTLLKVYLPLCRCIEGTIWIVRFMVHELTLVRSA